MREIGLIPDILICRTEVPISDDVRSKISLFCNVPKEAVLDEKDVDFSIYEIPVMLAEQKIDELIDDRLGLKAKKPDLSHWNQMLNLIKHPEREVTIAIVGKYLELNDAYKSIYESLAHAGIANRCKVTIKKVPADDVEKLGMERFMAGVGGILVPGGFGGRGIEGKIRAAQYAREKKIPYFGLCLGMQVAVIEFARNVAGLATANSTEFDEATPDPVIHIMEHQKRVTDKGATMRLGAYPCRITLDGAGVYRVESASERHRHRYEFGHLYRAPFEAKGALRRHLPGERSVEIYELVDTRVRRRPVPPRVPVAAHRRPPALPESSSARRATCFNLPRRRFRVDRRAPEVPPPAEFDLGRLHRGRRPDGPRGGVGSGAEGRASRSRPRPLRDRPARRPCRQDQGEPRPGRGAPPRGRPPPPPHGVRRGVPPPARGELIYTVTAVYSIISMFGPGGPLTDPATRR